MLRPHCAVGLVDRAEKAGLITRGQDADDLSVVRRRLTDTAPGSSRRSAG
jgi:DNA-binding MarR family transcriptional regulator